MRVPFLSVGWNRQFLMMQEFGFVYDATVVAPLADPPFWPYTLDYKMPHQCIGKMTEKNLFLRLNTYLPKVVVKLVEDVSAPLEHK